MKTALVIDDNTANLAAMAALLTREHVIPITLISPNGVTTVLNELGRVDVVFLDLVFPNYNGLTLIKELQADERLRNVPIVAYTVHTSEQNEAREAGFHSFIGKPVNVGRFHDQLKRIMSGIPVWEVD